MTDIANRVPEQTGLSRTLVNTETLQIAELHLLDVFCTPIEERFERITRLGVRALRMPVVAVTAVTHDRQWFKSVTGWDVCELPLNESLCARTVEKRRPVVIRDLTRHPRYSRHPHVVGPPKFRCYASVPLLSVKGTAIGTFCAMDFEPRKLSRGMYQSLLHLADLAQRELLAGLLQNAQSALISKLSIARRQALLDPLTQTWNRRGGMMLIESCLESAREDGHGLAVLAIDVDEFKQVNDNFGHAAGDQALRVVTRELLSCVRENDGVCRSGGDEFFVVINGVDCETIENIATRVKRRIEQSVFAAQDGRPVRVTVSIGARCVTGDYGGSAEELLAEADRVLYENKAEDRQAASGQSLTDG